jgi:tRNA(adenine34) deaminase
MMATQAATRRRGAKRTAAKRTTAKENSAKGSTGATKNGATKKRSTKTARGAAHRSSHGKRKWSAGVGTESTYPQEGLFKKDAETIARSLASKKVSPKGPSSGMRMLTFYVNRAGKNLPQSRLRVLERAKELLHERVEKARGSAKK